jgi:S1-C subfamily serine protease
VSLAVVMAFIVGAASGFAGGLLGAKYSGNSGSSGGSGPRSITVVPSKTSEPVVAASAVAVPSVVNIDVTQKAASGGQKGLPDAHPSVPLQGSGSGVAFKRAPNNGTYLLTNNHVVENAASITVRDTSGNKYKGTLVGRDADSDIAVVSIDAKLPIIPLGDSAKLVVGQTVVAIGSPFGLEHTVTSGVVSALGRSLPDFTADNNGSYPLVDVIQTDAAINPGNSGGALVDRQGQLIGINTAIYSESGASGGIGFAIPVSAATRVANALIAGDKVGHPFLGIVGLTITPEVQTQRKLTVGQGALIEEITKGTGADKADLKPGDVVTALDGEAVRSMDDLILLVRRHAVGDTVTLSIVRDGKAQKVQMTVGDRPANLQISNDATATAPKK